MEADRALARHYVHTGRMDLALPALRRLLAQDPEDRQLLRWYIQALYREDQILPAYEACQQLLAQDGEDLTGLFYLTTTSIALGLKKEAQQAAQTCLALAPHDPDSWYLEAFRLYHLNHLRKALEVATKGLALDPEHRGLMHLRASCLMELGETEASIEQLDFMQSRDAEDPDGHCARGWAILRQGDWRQARHHFKEALRLDPQHAAARAGLLQCLRSHHFLYRRSFQFKLWLGRFRPGHRLALIFGLLFAARFLRTAFIELGYPAIGNGILIAYGLFALSTFFLEPLTDLLLLCSADGRLVMTKEERRTAALCATMITLGGALLIQGSASASKDLSLIYFTLGASTILLYLPLRTALNRRLSRFRRWLAGILATVLLASLLASILIAWSQGPEGYPLADRFALMALFLGAFSTWIAA